MSFVTPYVYGLPWGLVAVCVLAGMYWLFVCIEQSRDARIAKLASARLLPSLVRGPWYARIRWHAWLTLAGVACLMAALMRPSLDTGVSGEAPAVSLDVLLALDVSPSMAAADMEPSRLDQAVRMAEGVLLAHPEHRFGVLAFGGSVDVACPLTVDHGHVKSVLRGLASAGGLMPGSAIGLALEEARRIFERGTPAGMPSGPEGRVVLLFTDGEDTLGGVKKAARDLGESATVWVAGFGTREGVELKPPRVSGEAVGGSHLTRIDEGLLQEAASEGGGEYLHVNGEPQDAQVLAEALRQAGGMATTRHAVRRGELYQWPLALAWLLFALEGVWVCILRFADKMGGRNWVKRYLVVLLALTLAGVPYAALADARSEGIERAEALTRTGDAVGAPGVLEPLLDTDAEDADELFAAGAAYAGMGDQCHTRGDHEGAARAWSQAADCFRQASMHGQGVLGRAAGFNEANSLARRAFALDAEGDGPEAETVMRGAIAAYENFLVTNPGHEGAEQNLEHTRYQLKRLLQRKADAANESGSGHTQEEASQGSDGERQEKPDAPEQAEAGETQASQGDQAGLTSKEPSSQDVPARQGATEAEAHEVEAILVKLEQEDAEEQARQAHMRPAAVAEAWW